MTEMVVGCEIPAQASPEPVHPMERLLDDIRHEIARNIKQGVAEGFITRAQATSPAVIVMYADAVLECRCIAESEWWAEYVDLSIADMEGLLGG